VKRRAVARNGEPSPKKRRVDSIRVKLLSETAKAPVRETEHAAGYDLSSVESGSIPAGSMKTFRTDVMVAIPTGYYGRVASRSGMAMKGIEVGAGVVDSDYRGNVFVLLRNHAEVPFEVCAGDRIAQLVLTKICTPEVEVVDELDSTERGDDGFGSTGM